MTIETDVAALTSAVNALSSAVVAQKATLDTTVAAAAAAATAVTTNGATQVALAVAQVAAATQSAATAGLSSSAASASAATALASATSAASARDSAIAAWAAATYPTETLAAISASLHVGPTVKSIIYDTSKDSDGGAWRKRCSGTAWYNEAIYGAWLGKKATAALAWATAGAVTGSLFQNSSDFLFYRLGASSPSVTEVFRGCSRGFPAQAAIVVETSRVVIYDLTQPNTPMWRVLRGNTSYSFVSDGYTFAASSVAAINGNVYVGLLQTTASQPGLYGGLLNFNFPKNVVTKVRAESPAASGYGDRPFTLAFSTQYQGVYSGSPVGVTDGRVSGITASVMNGAPFDATTGLQIPTVVVSTGGGISVLKDDGTSLRFADSTALNTRSFVGGYLDSRRRLVGQSVSNYSTQVWNDALTASKSFPDAVYRNAPYPLTIRTATTNDVKRTAVGYVARQDMGIAMFHENNSLPTSGMVAHITNSYNTGWQVGDSRLAALSETTAETAVSTEMIVNGDFGGGTVGWNAYNSTLSVVDGKLRCVNTVVGIGKPYQLVNTVVGKMYRIRVVVETITTQKSAVPMSGVLAAVRTGAYLYDFNFTAVSATTEVGIEGYSDVIGQYSDITSVSMKALETDRAVAPIGLAVVGSLTKAPVATGANLVAYSGFSATNYLEQPYNANLEFGTGDFCAMGWAYQTNGNGGQVLFRRGATTVIGLATVGGVVTFQGYTSNVATTKTLSLNAWEHICVLRVSGVLYVYANGVSTGLAYGAPASISDAGLGTLTIGNDNASHVSQFVGSLAMWRFSATAPSANQIAHIYRTELAMFQPGAQCTIAGSSTFVTALARDEVTELLHVGTSWGRSAFRDLVRTEVEASSGVIDLSVANGAVLTSKGVSVLYAQPSINLRDEARRKSGAKETLGKTPVYFDFSAVAAQVAFALPKGYTAKAAYSAGLVKRFGATKDYTVGFDGFVEVVTFNVAPGNATPVSIMAVCI